MGRFLDTPHGPEWDGHDETRPPLPADPDDLDPAHDFYPSYSDPQPVYVPRAARVGGRLRKQAS